MGLADRLILPAHHAERHDRAAVLGGKARDDRVQRPLARRDAIGMAGLDAEAAGAVLQQDACLVGDDRRTEGMRDRVDEGADVAVLVDHGDVDGRGIHRRRDVRQIEQPVHPDVPDVLVGEFPGENAGDVDMDLLGIADVLLAHHVGDARGLGLEMEALDAERGEFGQVEAGQDVEHHQHGDARAVRRALPDVMALVDGADRRRRFGGVAGKVLQRVQAADAAQGLDHVLGDAAAYRTRRGRPWRSRAASCRVPAGG